MLLLDAISWIDSHFAQALNASAARSGTFNHLLMQANNNSFIKMLPFAWMAAWYWNQAPIIANRRVVTRGLAGVCLGFFLGRILQTSLPMRLRPVHDAALGLTLPNGFSSDVLGGWSSMPSDHGAIFMALACMALALSRRWGALALLWAVAVALAPRVYFGEHYLSDMLAGMAIGGVAAVVALRTPLGWLAEAPVLWLNRRHVPLFYASALLFMAQLVDMFDDVRTSASVLKGLLMRGVF
jgi:undecaprenyl-diphosphatase